MRMLIAAAIAVILAAPARAADAIPNGAVAFFNLAGCPAGWVVYGSAEGRFLVPLPASAAAQNNEKTVAAPLTAGSDLMHSHASVAGTTQNRTTSYVGASDRGNPNKVGWTTGTPTVSTPAQPGTSEELSGIPYVTLLACRKISNPAIGSIPKNMLLFFPAVAQCPAGWRRAGGTGGRFLVAMPTGGTAGHEFGGTALGDQENRTHSHAASGTVTAETQKIGLGAGCCSSGWSASGDYAWSGSTSADPANVPYIQLLQCSKD